MGDGGAGMPVGGGQARGGAARAAARQPHGAAGRLQRTRSVRRGDSRHGARALGAPGHVGRSPPLKGRPRHPAAPAFCLIWHLRLIWRP